MSEDLRPNWQANPSGSGSTVGDPQTKWASWLIFAGVLLMIVGLLQLLEGFTALFDDGFYVVDSEGLLISVDYSIWGWAHVILGGLAMATSFLLLRGSRVGRLLAIGYAVVSSVVNLAFLPAYPWWAVLAVTFNVLVIYAITRHGGELKASSTSF
jgi:hypothetical protein